MKERSAMNKENDLKVKVSVRVKASTSEVWEALTNPEMIKQYLFGTETVTDPPAGEAGWKVGSRIIFRGMWEGKQYEDGGTILQIEPEKILQYTYWSSMSGIENIPENYYTITFELQQEEGETVLTLSNSNIKTENMKEHLTENWKMVLNSIKKLLETK